MLEKLFSSGERNYQNGFIEQSLIFIIIHHNVISVQLMLIIYQLPESYF